MRAGDAGYGYGRRADAEYQCQAAIGFMKRHLLGPDWAGCLLNRIRPRMERNDQPVLTPSRAAATVVLLRDAAEGTLPGPSFPVYRNERFEPLDDFGALLA